MEITSCRMRASPWNLKLVGVERVALLPLLVFIDKLALYGLVLLRRVLGQALVHHLAQLASLLLLCHELSTSSLHSEKLSMMVSPCRSERFSLKKRVCNTATNASAKSCPPSARTRRCSACWPET